MRQGAHGNQAFLLGISGGRTHKPSFPKLSRYHRRHRWAYAQNTPNSGSRAAVFTHEIVGGSVRSLFTKRLLYH